MRKTGPVVFVLCLLAAFHATARTRVAAASPPTAASGPVNLCAPPEESTSGWQIIWLHGGTIKVPSDYAVAGNAFNRKIFEKGNRTVGFETWMGLGGLNETAMNQISTCKITLGGRPARITLLQGANRVWWAVASWDALPDGRSFDVYMFAQYPTDLMEMRAILWSAQFPGYDMAEAAPACGKPAPPVVDVATVLDTGLVSMLAGQESPPLAVGTAVFEISFDSTGGLMPLEITETDLPDATIKRVAVLVGSNVKPQAAGAPRAAVKLMVTPAGVSYTAVAALGCIGR